MAALKTEQVTTTTFVTPLGAGATSTFQTASPVEVSSALAIPDVWGAWAAPVDAPSFIDTLNRLAAPTLNRLTNLFSLWTPSERAAVVSDVESFASLSKPAQEAKLAGLQAERAQLGARLQQVIAAVDERFRAAPDERKVKALRQYHSAGQHLDPVTKQELEGLIRRAEQAEASLVMMRAQLQNAPAGEQATLQQQIQDASTRQGQTVQQAVVVIDRQGLYVDFLAVTQQVIDPTAPPPGAPDSLLGLMCRAYTLDAQIAAYQAVLEANKAHEKALERKADDARAEAKHRRRAEDRKRAAIRKAIDTIRIENALREKAAYRALVAALNRRLQLQPR